MSILVLTSDTLIGTPATGNIEYSGQFYGTDSNASRAQIQRITQGTAVASTSGTSIDFTGLPAWVKRITVMFSGVSLSATAHFLIQPGTGGTPTSTGYASTSFALATAGAPSISSTSGFIFYANGAAAVFSGNITISNITGNTWVASGVLAQTAGTAANITGAGTVALGGVLNILRITTTSTDTFDAGSINILYEG